MFLLVFQQPVFAFGLNASEVLDVDFLLDLVVVLIFFVVRVRNEPFLHEAFEIKFDVVRKVHELVSQHLQLQRVGLSVVHSLAHREEQVLALVVEGGVAVEDLGDVVQVVLELL